MSTPLACPTCSGELIVHDDGSFRCAEDHFYTVVGLALTTNISALKALWMAIRALEDDAAGLEYMAGHYGDDFGMSAVKRGEEALAAREAADRLRIHARRAQTRLDALPSTPSDVGGSGSEAVRGA